MLFFSLVFQASLPVSLHPVSVWSCFLGLLSFRSAVVPGLSSSPHLLSGIVSDVSGGGSSVSCAPSEDRKDVGQRRIGDCSRSRTRFLQSPFSDGKGNGRWRPVIDLSPLNGFVRQTPFKMETAASVLLSV